jgi:hypothetical protein
VEGEVGAVVDEAAVAVVVDVVVEVGEVFV